MGSSMPALYSGHCLILQLVGMLRWVCAGGEVSMVWMEVIRVGRIDGDVIN